MLFPLTFSIKWEGPNLFHYYYIQWLNTQSLTTGLYESIYVPRMFFKVSSDTFLTRVFCDRPTLSPALLRRECAVKAEGGNSYYFLQMEMWHASVAVSTLQNHFSLQKAASLLCLNKLPYLQSQTFAHISLQRSSISGRLPGDWWCTVHNLSFLILNLI